MTHREPPVETTNTDKIMFPEAGFRKRDLLEYYERIADTMLPYLSNRPLTMERYPEGLDADGFYQKVVPDHFPRWIERIEIQLKTEPRKQTQMMCNSAAALLYVVNQGCITPHVWLSRSDRLNSPDRMIFDLDPPGDSFDAVRYTAQALNELLDKLGLSSLIMTTGSRGVHVVVPLERAHTFEQVRHFAQLVTAKLAHAHPDRMTTEHRKARRGRRVYLDAGRNSYGQTAVSPYAVRARPGAPVAMPLAWVELERSDLTSRSYHMDNVFRRLGQVGDRWQQRPPAGQALDGKWDQLYSLAGEWLGGEESD